MLKFLAVVLFGVTSLCADVDVYSARLDTTTDTVMLVFFPNLNPHQGVDLLYDESGIINEVTLGIVDMTAQERVCANPIPTTGALAFMCADSTGTNPQTPVAELHAGEMGDSFDFRVFSLMSSVHVFEHIETNQFKSGGLSNDFSVSPIPEPRSVSFLLCFVMIGLGIVRHPTALKFPKSLNFRRFTAIAYEISGR
jgi:hypothetical protein